MIDERGATIDGMVDWSSLWLLVMEGKRDPFASVSANRRFVADIIFRRILDRRQQLSGNCRLQGWGPCCEGP